MQIKIENSRILLVSHCGDIEEITPKQIYDLIQQLQVALFDWSKLTGKKVDVPECY